MKLVAFDIVKNEIFVRTFYVLKFSHFMTVDPITLCRSVKIGEELETILH